MATTPRRRPNKELRTREHLTVVEVEWLMEAAKKNRWGHRDSTMVLVAYRHGLRVSELVDLRWDQIHGHAARSQGQAGHTKHPSNPRRRVARPAAASARTGSQVTVRVHVRTGQPVHHCRLCPYGGTCWRRGQAPVQGSPAHAAARLRLRPSQQGARHAGFASLPRTQEYPAYGALHRDGADAV